MISYSGIRQLLADWQVAETADRAGRSLRDEIGPVFDAFLAHGDGTIETEGPLQQHIRRVTTHDEAVSGIRFCITAMERDPLVSAASRAFGALFQRMKSDPTIRSNAAEEELVAGLQSSNSYVKTNCLMGLNTLGAVRALSEIMCLLSDADPNVRVAAIHNAMMLSRDRLLSQIQAIAQADSEPRVREAAKRAIGEKGT